MYEFCAGFTNAKQQLLTRYAFRFLLAKKTEEDLKRNAYRE